MDMAVRRGLSAILIVLLVAGALCVLDGSGPAVDVCLMLLVLTPGAVSLVHLVPAGLVTPLLRRRRWLLLHPSPPSPI